MQKALSKAPDSPFQLLVKSVQLLFDVFSHEVSLRSGPNWLARRLSRAGLEGLSELCETLLGVEA